MSLRIGTTKTAKTVMDTKLISTYVQQLKKNKQYYELCGSFFFVDCGILALSTYANIFDHPVHFA